MATPLRAPETSPMAKLTDRLVRSLKEDGRFGDGKGLYFVRRGGSTTWHLRWMTAGKAREMSLGSYPEVGLAEARDRAMEARRAIKAGVDPVAARVEQKGTVAHTFRKSADDYIAAHRPGWRNDKHAAQWRATLDQYVMPILGDKDVATITTADILSILKPLWTTKTETANRVRGRVENILDAAKVLGWREGENPARWRGHLDHILPARASVARVEHHAALPYADLPALMRRIAEREGMASRCLAFIAHTAARSGEARGATWDEIDLDARVWTIGPDRMKAGVEHRVPLTDEAVEILLAVQPLARGPASVVFPSERKGRPLSDVGVSKALHTAGAEGATVHGLRSSFRDWAVERTAYPRAAAEKALAHSNKDKVEAAYQRSDLLEMRRRLMTEWSKFLTAGEQRGAVVPLRSAS